MPEKLTIVEINSVPFGSTGGIMRNVAEQARKAGHRVFVCYPDGRHNPVGKLRDSVMIGGRVSEDSHILLHRMTGLNGYFSVISTLAFIRKLKEIQPDVIHLHNLHNCYINLPMLFGYLRKSGVRTFWTLHDCWALTGHCPHFDYAGCEKWKTGCHDCPLYREYPESLVDSSRLMWKKKKEWFTGVPNLSIITPSAWLAEQVRESFLKEYPVHVIRSGIDLEVFRPTESSFREEHGLNGKHVLLGVAMEWTEKKGIDVFRTLAKDLGDDYGLVLVSAAEGMERTLPEGVILMNKKGTPSELAKVYSAADLFVNPTREEALGLVNLEALACGTPVVTFRSGGSPECVDASCGEVTERDEIKALENAIRRIVSEKPYSAEGCRNWALQFDRNDVYRRYVELYETGGKGS